MLSVLSEKAKNTERDHHGETMSGPRD
jgi:hypothetical protein